MLAPGYGDKADAFYQKRVPKGAPDYVETATVTFPSGRTADEVCPTEVAVPAWAAQMGTLTFHPWPVRRDRPDHPDELRIDLDPHGGDRLPRRGPGRRRRPRAARRTSAWSASRRPAATAACTSTSGSSRGGTSSTCGTPPSRSGASWSAVRTGVTTNWWKEERGDDDLRRLQPERPRPHHRVGLQPAAQARRAGVARRWSGTSSPRSRTRAAFNLFTRAGAVRRARRRARRHRRRAPATCTPLLDLYVEQALRSGRCPTRRTTPRCRGSRRACSRARRSRRTGTSPD